MTKLMYWLILCVTIKCIASLPSHSSKLSNSKFKSKLLRSLEDIISNNRGHKSQEILEEDPDIRAKNNISEIQPCPKNETVELDAQEIDIYDINQRDVKFTVAEPNVTVSKIKQIPIKRNKFLSKLEALRQKTNNPQEPETRLPDMVPIFKPRRLGQPSGLPTEFEVRQGVPDNDKNSDQTLYNQNQTLEIKSPLNLAYLNSLVSSGVVNTFGRDPMASSLYTPNMPNQGTLIDGTPPYGISHDPSNMVPYGSNAVAPNNAVQNAPNAISLNTPYTPNGIPYDPNNVVYYAPTGMLNNPVPIPYEHFSSNEASLHNSAMPNFNNHQGVFPMPYNNGMGNPIVPQANQFADGASPIPAFPNSTPKDQSTMVIYKPEIISLDQIQGDYLKRTTMTVLVPLQTTKLDNSMAMNIS